MSTSLYWKIKQPADQRLPIGLKWKLEKYRYKQIPSLEWLEGYISAMDEKSEDYEQVCDLYEAIETHGADRIELEWR